MMMMLPLSSFRSLVVFSRRHQIFTPPPPKPPMTKSFQSSPETHFVVSSVRVRFVVAFLCILFQQKKKIILLVLFSCIIQICLLCVFFYTFIVSIFLPSSLLDVLFCLRYWVRFFAVVVLKFFQIYKFTIYGFASIFSVIFQLWSFLSGLYYNYNICKFLCVRVCVCVSRETECEV